MLVLLLGWDFLSTKFTLQLRHLRCFKTDFLPKVVFFWSDLFRWIWRRSPDVLPSKILEFLFQKWKIIQFCFKFKPGAIRFFFYKNNSEVKTYHGSGTKSLNKSLNQQIMYKMFVLFFSEIMLFHMILEIVPLIGYLNI